MNKNAAKMILKETTLDHQVLYINKTSLIKDEDRLRVYKADKIDKKYKLGNPEWRRLIDSKKTERRTTKNEIQEIRSSISKGKSDLDGGIRKFLEYSYDAYRYN